jgi:coenzyme F420-reducing hydrogenase delta subunit
MIKISILVLLTIISFQLYAKVTNDILVTSNKNQQEKLERGVSELGAERERVRAISREIHHNTKTGYKINNPDYKATRIISNKERLEKLERRVSELGAERKRARAQIQDRK